MEYPLYIKNKLAGTLSVTREGLFTRFEADCPDTGELTRLYISGGGQRVCLGVMLPRNGRMTLKKSFSRAAMSSFPSVIDCASDAALPPKDDGGSLLWLSSPNGILYSDDGEKKLVALPADSSRFRVRHIIRNINGRDYAVFPGKNRSISKKDW